MQSMTKTLCLAVLVLAFALAPAAFAKDKAPAKVFILAGQSNMEGKAPLDLLRHQMTDPKTADGRAGR